jgi:hypothetical protein
MKQYVFISMDTNSTPSRYANFTENVSGMLEAVLATTDVI